MLITHAGGSPHHGPNMRWYYLGQALKKVGIEVEIVSSSWFHKYLHAPDLIDKYDQQTVDGLVYHWIKTKAYVGRGVRQVFNQAQFVAGLYSSSKMLARREPDIIIASSPHPFVVYPAVKLARKTGARFIYEVRDLWPALLLELGSFSKFHPYILANKAAESFAVKHAEKVLSVKPGDFDYFNQQYGLPADKFEYIPNGFLPDNNKSPTINTVKELRNRYRHIVGYVGAISNYYGLEEMVELASRFRDNPDVGFVVVGDGNRAAAIRELATQKQLSNFHMVGRIDKLAVPATLDTFDICYLALEDLDIHKYGISCNKLYEYMYAGKPVLGSYSAGHDPVVASGCGFTIKPGNPVKLASTLKTMLADNFPRIETGAKGRAYFEETHHFSKVAETLIEKVINPS
jgi:glycosyltransferase involved in cell wall biosynthesis